MVYFDQILHTYACQHSLTTAIGNNFSEIDEGLLSISSVRQQLVTMSITFEPHGVFFYHTLVNIP